MNHLHFDQHLIRQRNEEMLREVQEIRQEQELRATREASSGQQANNLIWQVVLSLLRGAGL